MRDENHNHSRMGRAWSAAAAMVLLFGGATGCGLIVTQRAYEEDQKKIRSDLQFLRKQMLAHTQVLANHGKAINENRLQLRDALTALKGGARPRRRMKSASLSSAKAGRPVRKPPRRRKPAARARVRRKPAGRTMFVRGSYQGLPLNYAGGYRTPRGRRYPYKLTPGTRVHVLSGDDRGFTRIEVLSGRWKGKRMWVRTIWLIKRPDIRRRGRSRARPGGFPTPS